MREVCYCGRTGEIEDRQPVADEGTGVLQCPDCGHRDDLAWLPELARRSVLAEAERRSLRRGTRLTA